MKTWILPLLALCVACKEPAPTDRIRVAGHVEATETRVAPEAGGRILSVSVKEGDRVQQGDAIITLDTRDTELAPGETVKLDLSLAPR